MPLTNVLAILAFISLVLSFWKTKDGGFKVNWLKYLLIFVVGVVVLIVTISKNGQDTNSAKASKSSADSVKILLVTLNSSNRTIVEQVNKIDTMQQYLKRLDSIGIKRNEKTNQPILTTKYYNRIDKVSTLNQY